MTDQQTPGNGLVGSVESRKVQEPRIVVSNEVEPGFGAAGVNITFNDFLEIKARFINLGSSTKLLLRKFTLPK